jgi:hypothetical protein
MLGVDEWTFDVCTEDFGCPRKASVSSRTIRGQTIEDDPQRGANDGRTERGHAMARERPSDVTHGRPPVSRRGQVDSARAVDLQVDQPRRDPARVDDDVCRVRPRRRLDADDPPIGDPHATRRQLCTVGQHAPPQRKLRGLP